MTQNRSDAVMAQRGRDDKIGTPLRNTSATKEAPGMMGLGDFPTPPWAVRALFKHVIEVRDDCLSAIVAGCGRGYLADVVKEHFVDVLAVDVHDYGYPGTIVADFLTFDTGPVDWVISSPPFTLAQGFVERGLQIAHRGVAILTRLNFMESQKRFDFFSVSPPSIVAVFAERVPMIQGVLDPKASVATSFCWVALRMKLIRRTSSSNSSRPV